MIFEPIIGLEISLRYVLAAQTALDRRVRAATLAMRPLVLFLQRILQQTRLLEVR